MRFIVTGICCQSWSGEGLEAIAVFDFCADNVDVRCVVGGGLSRDAQDDDEWQAKSDHSGPLRSIRRLTEDADDR